MLALLLESLYAVGALILQSPQESGGPTQNPGGLALFRFFIGLLLVLTLYSGALLFTYWISKDD